MAQSPYPFVPDDDAIKAIMEKNRHAYLCGCGIILIGARRTRVLHKRARHAPASRVPQKKVPITPELVIKFYNPNVLRVAAITGGSVLYSAAAHLRPMFITVPGESGSLHLMSNDTLAFMPHGADATVTIERGDIKSTDVYKEDGETFSRLYMRTNSLYSCIDAARRPGDPGPWMAWHKGPRSSDA